MVLDNPQRRRKVVEMLWDLAYRKIEGPDNAGGPIDPDAVWRTFNDQLAEIGLELTVTPADGSEAFVPNDELTTLIDEAKLGGR